MEILREHKGIKFSKPLMLIRNDKELMENLDWAMDVILVEV